MNSRTIKGVFSILAISILAVHGAAQNSGRIPDSNRARAVALWEEVIKAKGGRERLHSIQNVLIVSKVNVEASQRFGPSETRKLYVLPDQALLQASSPQAGVVMDAVVFSIDRKLCIMKISPGKAAAGPSPCSLTTWRPQLIQDPVIYLLETKWLQPNLLGTRVEGSGSNRVDVIEVEINELRVDLYLGRRTRLPFRLVTNKSDGTRQLSARGAVTIKLNDYTSVDGIQMPRSITRDSVARSTMVSRDVEDAQYSFNVLYDRSLFEAR